MLKVEYPPPNLLNIPKISKVNTAGSPACVASFQQVQIHVVFNKNIFPNLLTLTLFCEVNLNRTKKFHT